MWSKKLGFLFLLASFALFSALPVFASTITVTSTSDSGPGTLRAAIAAAAPGDTINFNLAYPATITVASPLVIATTLTINGPGAANLAVSGGSAVGVFQITAGTVSISGLTIENGSVESGEGGGINNSATMTVTSCTFASNDGGRSGGGIYNTGTATVTDSTFSSNMGGGISGGGGGMYNGGTATVTSSTFSGNFGVPGAGAIYNDGMMTITGSTFSQNDTNADGGGIENDTAGKLTISNSTISQSEANGGGGLLNYGTMVVLESTISNNGAEIGGAGIRSTGTLTVVNSTITGNSGSEGSGIESSGTLTVTNSTISGNTAVYPFGGGIEAGNATIKNTILASNSANLSAGNCYFTGSVTSDGHNLSDDTSCADFFTGVGDLNNTPSGLDPAGLKNNGGPTQTIALLSGPAIYDIPLSPVNYCTLTDGVTPVATDQRGVTRPQSPQGCSIGAFEPQAPSAYAQLQALYAAVENQIAALPSTDKADCDKDDRRQLQDAADQLSEMLDAKNWSGIDGDHLVADRSFRFFEDDRQATEDLTRILHDRDDHQESTLIPSQEIQTDLASLAAANRLLATTAIAGASAKHPDLIARAKDKLADGDAALAGGNYERAIDDYQRAWSLAEDVR